ncbi:hypothetical protein KDW36_23280 [Burkholderia dolosa]|uniref:hypothetical protein n=1 Tax=Burkholderia dolosa TaxID=152500 RepID=UPI001B912752|nr:hypothetical protein [Burkholderia dolosa]MBR8316104.1 hypothetical protein [Burkholderia dolosa]
MRELRPFSTASGRIANPDCRRNAGDRSAVSGVDIRVSKRLGTLCIRSVRIADASRLATSRVDNPGTKRREMLCIRTVSVGAGRATGLIQHGFAVCDDGFECRPPVT